MRKLLLLFSILASPAFANDGCHDLWFTRNQVMHNAGYCFGSTLGRSIFNNAGCIGKSVSLSGNDQKFVAHIQGLETQFQCRVNTRQTFLDIDDLLIRRKLFQLPVRDEFSSACLGWTGAPTPLFAGTGAGTPVIGQINPNDYVRFDHWNAGSWTYVTTTTNNWDIISGGWLQLTGEEFPCREFAG